MKILNYIKKYVFFLFTLFKHIINLNSTVPATTDIKLLSKYIKLLQNIFFLIIMITFEPEELINHASGLDDTEKKILMVFFIVFSTFLSHVLTNYEWQKSDSNVTRCSVEAGLLESIGYRGGPKK